MTWIDDPVTFVVPGDLHLTEPGLENHQTALKMIDDLNQWIRPDFVQFIGDNVQDATEAQFRLFDDLRRRLTAPHYALVGDHDVHDDAGPQRFQARFGETFGSTSLRGFRFLRLDTQQSKPLGMTSRQLAWLAREFNQAIASGEKVVLFQHNYPFQICENFDGPGIDEWRLIIQTWRVEAIVCGHTHYWQVANDGRNAMIAVRSIGDPEGGSPGYLIGHAQGDDFAVYYRSVVDQGPLILITHPRNLIFATRPAHVVSGQDRVSVRIWSKAGVESVDGWLDETMRVMLEQEDHQTWSCPLSGDRLSKGTHRLEVRAFDREGLEGRQKIDFAVDPTGRFTAVPNAIPRVDSTAFC